MFFFLKKLPIQLSREVASILFVQLELQGQLLKILMLEPYIRGFCRAVQSLGNVTVESRGGNKHGEAM